MKSPSVHLLSTTILTASDGLKAGGWQFEGFNSGDDGFVGLGRVNHNDKTFMSTLWPGSTSHREQVRDLHMGDWLLRYMFGGKQYIFVFPMSRSQSLPPLGDGWVQVYTSPDEEEGRLQNPTVQLEYIFGDL